MITESWQKNNSCCSFPDIFPLSHIIWIIREISNDCDDVATSTNSENLTYSLKQHILKYSSPVM